MFTNTAPSVMLTSVSGLGPLGDLTCCSRQPTRSDIFSRRNCPQEENDSWNEWFSSLKKCPNHHLLSGMQHTVLQREICVVVTIKQARRLPRALGQKGRQNYNCVVQNVTNAHRRKGNEPDKNEWNTLSRSLWEDQGTTLFQNCCKRVNICPINFTFTYARQSVSQFDINFIHVINFSNVQNVLRISVMYVMSKVRILALKGRWNGSCLRCSQVYQWFAVRTSETCPPGHTLSSSLQNCKVTTSVLFTSCFLILPAWVAFTRGGSLH